MLSTLPPGGSQPPSQAASGLRTHVSNLTIGSATYNGLVDLDLILEPRGSTAARANTGLISQGTDIAQRFRAITHGGSPLPQPTGLTSGSADVGTLFAMKGSIGDDGGGGGGGCLPYGTKIVLWDGGTTRIEDIQLGDVLTGFFLPGMRDEDDPAWREWTTPEASVSDGEWLPVHVVTTIHDRYHTHFLINNTLRATWEHDFLVLRDGLWRWMPMRDIAIGDSLLGNDGAPWPVTSKQAIEVETRVVTLNVETIDTYLTAVDTPTGPAAILTHNADNTAPKV